MSPEARASLERRLALTADLVERRRQGRNLLPRVAEELRALEGQPPSPEMEEQRRLVERVLDFLSVPPPTMF